MNTATPASACTPRRRSTTAPPTEIRAARAATLDAAYAANPAPVPPPPAHPTQAAHRRLDQQPHHQQRRTEEILTICLKGLDRFREDCRQVTRQLEADLLRAGEAVLRVPARLMAADRKSGRERGKSDPIDALAVARSALREDNPPVACLDGPARELLACRPSAGLGHGADSDPEPFALASPRLSPGMALPPKSLRRLHVLDDLEARLPGSQGRWR